MGDIFLSYAKQDRALAESAVQALSSAGHAVWWDRRILPVEEWDRQIEKELLAARAVVVLWTPHSVESKWVRVEAHHAMDQRKLFQVVCGCEPPFGFGLNQYADLGTPPSLKGPEWDKLLAWLGGCGLVEQVDGWRRDWTNRADCASLVRRMRHDVIRRLVTGALGPVRPIHEVDLLTLSEKVARILNIAPPIESWLREPGISANGVIERLTREVDQTYAQKAAMLGPERLRGIEKQVLLQVLDASQREHSDRSVAEFIEIFEEKITCVLLAIKVEGEAGVTPRKGLRWPV